MKVFKLLDLPYTRIPCFDHTVDLGIRDMDQKPARSGKVATKLKQAKPPRGEKLGCPEWAGVWAPVAALNLRFARSGKTVRAYMRKWSSTFPSERRSS